MTKFLVDLACAAVFAATIAAPFIMYFAWWMTP